jgi:organic radical activating enzyme
MMQENNIPNPLDTVCDLKWNYPIFNMERGEFRSCCRTPSNKITEESLQKFGIDAFSNSDREKQERLDLINGVKIKPCQSCWNLENKDMKSPRHTNERFHWFMKKQQVIPNELEYSDDTLLKYLDSIKHLDHPALKSTTPYMVEISLGNTCDMKCMYCSHHYSTQWATEKIKYGEITQLQYDREFPKAPPSFNDKFWEWFDEIGRHHLMRVGIIGGEPLIMPEFYKFVEKLIDSVSQITRKNKMIFWIVTNMNTPPNYLEKLLKFFPRLTEVFDIELLVSLEATGKKAEYIRNGLSWDRLERNLDKILSRTDLKFNFGFIISTNILSVGNFKDFITFAEDIYRKYNRPVALKHNVVSFPDWQSPFVLTPDFADHIDDCIAYMKTKENEMPIITHDLYGQWGQYIIFLENLSTSIRNGTGDKTKERKKFVEWFNTFDERRKLNLLETFPEYTAFYNYCKTL